MSIENLTSKAELMRFIREEVENEPLPPGAVEGLAQATTPGKWTALTLENGWANYGAGYAQAAYRTIPGGMVQLRGLIAKATAFSGLRIAKIPPAMAPKESEEFTTSAAVEELAVIAVQSNGEILAYAETAEGDAASLSLSSIFFTAGN